jgi:Phytoene dehydrogenase and related proteins
VKGVYLCGSGAHPGGGVTGVPGHNAAREVLRDLAAGPHQALTAEYSALGGGAPGVPWRPERPSRQKGAARKTNNIAVRAQGVRMSFISVATRFAGFLACAALLGTSPCALAVPGVFIYYSPSTIVQGGNSVLGIEFIDQDGAGFTGGFVSPAAFTYPAQVINTGVVSSNSCTGSVVTANPGASTFSVSGVSVAPPPAQSFCVVEIQVSTSAAGSYPTTFPVAAFSASTGTNADPSVGDARGEPGLPGDEHERQRDRFPA